MCLYPRLIKNRKYTITKKNNGIIPIPIDERVLTVPIKCNKCMECMKAKSKEWMVRLQEDIRHQKHAIFVTLTFSNESIKDLYEELKTYKGYELDNKIATLAVRRFTERWRKEYKKTIRHWLITELGHEGTENIHLHGIIWTNKKIETIAKIWKYGYIWPRDDKTENYVNNKTINYITKYITKQDKLHKEYRPKILTSKGIGAGYMTRLDSNLHKYQPNKTKETYTTKTGHKIGLPIYWRNKLWTEEDREKLWIEKLNKNERWVCGEKINISTNKGIEEYYKTLNYYQKKAKKLGYLDDTKNWDRKKYEEERRQFKLEERIKNT